MNRTIAVLLFAVGSLVVLSLVMLASATMLKEYESWSDSWLFKQAVACGLGFLGFLAAATVDLKWLQRVVWPVYGLALVLLALVLSPLGHAAGGAQRWLFGTQPSEFAKVALVLVLAWFGARFRHRMQTFSTGILGMGVLALPMLGLIVLEPDLGTTALFGLVTMLLMLVAGVRFTHVGLTGLAGAGALAALISQSEYAMKRIRGFLDPDANPEGAMQLKQALYAFANGGVEGTGLGLGAQKFKIPEQHTDFIFPVIGEELGLVITLAVVLAFLVILFCGALITHRAEEPFALLLAAGVTFLICAQACVNMSVVTGLVPNKGMPLPLVSRGGTGMVVMLCLVGLLVNVARQGQAAPAVRPARRKGNPFNEPDTELPQ